jgi:hypothetical protein
MSSMTEARLSVSQAVAIMSAPRSPGKPALRPDAAASGTVSVLDFGVAHDSLEG